MAVQNSPSNFGGMVCEDLSQDVLPADFPFLAVTSYSHHLPLLFWHIRLCQVTEQHSAFATCDSYVLHMLLFPHEHMRQTIGLCSMVWRLSNHDLKPEAQNTQTYSHTFLKIDFALLRAISLSLQKS